VAFGGLRNAAELADNCRASLGPDGSSRYARAGSNPSLHGQWHELLVGSGNSLGSLLGGLGIGGGGTEEFL